MGVLITVLIVLVICGILYIRGAGQSRAKEASAPLDISVDYETDFWKRMYREFSCEWEIRDGHLVIDYEIQNPTNWPWYGAPTTTLCALVFDAHGAYRSQWEQTVRDYELRLFSCRGKIKIPLHALEEGGSVRVTVQEE